jgi:hypothetical protein
MNTYMQENLMKSEQGPSRVLTKTVLSKAPSSKIQNMTFLLLKILQTSHADR